MLRLSRKVIQHITELQNSSGQRDPLQIIQSSYIDRDTFQYPSLLQTISNLALDTSRHGAATISLGNLCQSFTPLTVRNLFFISNLNLPPFNSNHREEEKYYAEKPKKFPTEGRSGVEGKQGLENATQSGEVLKSGCTGRNEHLKKYNSIPCTSGMRQELENGCS